MRLIAPFLTLVVLIAALFATAFEPFRLKPLLRPILFARDCVLAAVRPAFRSQAGMLFQRINRSSPERVFVVAYQSYSTAALTAGQGVIWDFATDADGVGITRPSARATNAGMAAAGVIAENSLAAGAYGLVQVYGYNASVRMRTVTGGSPAIVAGRPLVINVAGSVFCLESVSTASTVILTFPMGFSLGATSGFTTATKPAFIKAL